MKLTDIAWIDYLVIGVILLSIVISIFRGFVREAMSLFSWIIAIVVAISFSPALADYLEFMISNDTARIVTAFIVLLVITVLIGALLNRGLYAIVKKTGLTGTDRVLGSLFGFARGVLLMSVLVLLGATMHMQKQPWWEKSITIPYLKPVSNWLKDFLPEKEGIHLD